MGRPISSNARCLKGCQKILEVNPAGIFTREDVAGWCDVSMKYGYQIITYGVTQGYIDIAKKDYENNTTYYQLRGAGKKWLTRRWVNGSLDSDDQEPGRAIVPVRNGEHREETNIRDTTANAIKRSKQIYACMSAPASERAKFRRLWNSSSS